MIDLDQLCDNCTPMIDGYPQSDEHARTAHVPAWFCQTCDQTVPIVVSDERQHESFSHIVKVVYSKDGEVKRKAYVCAGPVVYVDQACSVKGCACDEFQSIESASERQSMARSL